jgi:hypothetical protein
MILNDVVALSALWNARSWAMSGSGQAINVPPALNVSDASFRTYEPISRLQPVEPWILESFSLKITCGSRCLSPTTTSWSPKLTSFQYVFSNVVCASGVPHVSLGVMLSNFSTTSVG